MVTDEPTEGLSRSVLRYLDSITEEWLSPPPTVEDVKRSLISATSSAVPVWISPPMEDVCRQFADGLTYFDLSADDLEPFHLPIDPDTMIPYPAFLDFGRDSFLIHPNRSSRSAWTFQTCFVFWITRDSKGPIWLFVHRDFRHPSTSQRIDRTESIDPLADQRPDNYDPRWPALPLACLRLMWQKLPRITREAPSREAERRMTRDGLPISDVTTVTLRRQETRYQDRDDPGFVDWSHRWLVRGHVRRLSDRQTWVRPHVKGPEDKPLVLKHRRYRLSR